MFKAVLAVPVMSQIVCAAPTSVWIRLEVRSRCSRKGCSSCRFYILTPSGLCTREHYEGYHAVCRLFCTLLKQSSSGGVQR